MDYKGILTYEDTTLYETELKLFKEPRWLNDNCISFYLDYLQNTIIGKEEIFESKITVLHPSTVSWTIFETDFEDIEDQLFPLKLGIRDYWIIPLNDNQNKLLPGGGSHWALLLVLIKEKKCLLIDSSPGSKNIFNNGSSILLKLQKLCHFADEFQIELYKHSPKQVNSYDCGMYALSNIQLLLEEYKIYKMIIVKDELFRHITPFYINSKRVEIANLIYKLALNE